MKPAEFHALPTVMRISSGVPAISLLLVLWSAVERRAATRCWSRAVSPIDLDPTCLCGVADNERDCPCSAADADVARALAELEAL